MSSASDVTFRRAQALYTLRGLPLEVIARRFALPLTQLEERSRSEQWDSHRIMHLVEVSTASDVKARAIQREPDPVLRHSLVADLLVSMSHDLALALSAAADPDTVKAIRSRGEALRTLTESAERAVLLAREARGIVKGQASVQEQDDFHGVEYTVVLTPEGKDNDHYTPK